MRTIAIIGTDLNGPEAWWAQYPWIERPLDPKWSMTDRGTCDGIVYEAAGIAGVDAMAILLRGDWDQGFATPQLKAAIEQYPGPFVGGQAPTLLPFIDTGGTSSCTTEGGTQPEVIFDFSNDRHLELFWLHLVKPFFVQFPEGAAGVKNPIRYERSKNGRIVIVLWSINQSGRGITSQRFAQRLLDRIATRMTEMGLGVPDCIVDQSWVAYAPALKPFAVHSWFDASAKTPYSLRRFNGVTTGVAVPGFHVRAQPTWVIPRNDGQTFRDALAKIRAASADYTIIEGFVDSSESAGCYRSSAWSSPTLYLDILREHIHPGVVAPPVPPPAPPIVPDTKDDPVSLPFDAAIPTTAEGQIVGFSTEPLLSFRYGDLIKVGDYYAVLYPAGGDTVLSVQRDGSLETRPRAALGAWETCRLINGKLVYQIAGRIFAFPLIEGLLL